jgi:hypothetical protein
MTFDGPATLTESLPLDSVLGHAGPSNLERARYLLKVARGRGYGIARARRQLYLAMANQLGADPDKADPRPTPRFASEARVFPVAESGDRFGRDETASDTPNDWDRGTEWNAYRRADAGVCCAALEGLRTAPRERQGQNTN